MGNFINTTYKDTMESIVNITKDLIDNPLYIFNDKKALEVEYCHINAEKSTLDEAASIPYSDLGYNCPFRFNLIHGMFIYGAEKIQLSLENGEVGLESGEIAGESSILPGTIIPYPGDYFWIKHVSDSTWLFRINDVQKDTLENGSNGYKISYKLEHDDNSNILPLIVDEFDMLVSNIGTSFSPIIQSSKYAVMEILDTASVQLKSYFKDLFFNTRVQTFIFLGMYTDRFYDPYMIEFLRRNKILDNSGQKDYVYVDHKLPMGNTFGIDYNKTFFRSIELKDIKHLRKARTKSTADYIDNIMTIFNKRPEDYFCMNYRVDSYEMVPTIYSVHDIMTCLPDDVVTNIVEHRYFTKDNDYVIFNILIKYFYNEDITVEDIEDLDIIDFRDNQTLFYGVPILIMCLDSAIKEMMRQTYK